MGEIGKGTEWRSMYLASPLTEAMVHERTIEELLGREKGECRLYTFEW
jgi:hypothetical protein